MQQKQHEARVNISVGDAAESEMMHLSTRQDTTAEEVVSETRGAAVA